MEYVGGGSLADRLDGTPRPPRAAARLVETLARAMAEAHRLGVVHRDLKPGNILLTTDGVPKIADFGLAKLLDVDSGLTRTDSVLGTPSYMAPEQAEGKTEEIGPAADVYALGAILYECSTGRPPFRGATVLDTLQQVKTAEPVPPSRLVPGCRGTSRRSCLKCLAEGPGKRYDSAAALAEDLRRFRPASRSWRGRWARSERAWRCWRNPVVAGLLGDAAAGCRWRRRGDTSLCVLAVGCAAPRQRTPDRAATPSTASTSLTAQSPGNDHQAPAPTRDLPDGRLPSREDAAPGHLDWDNLRPVSPTNWPRDLRMACRSWGL